MPIQQLEHAFYKTEYRANLGLAAFQENALLPNLFKRISGETFKYALNDTITWTTQRVTTARDYYWRSRPEPIVFDRIGQASVDIKIDKHIYNAIPITDETYTMDMRSFQRDFAEPQIASVVQKANSKVLIALRNADWKTALPSPTETDDPYRYALAVKYIMDRNRAPLGGRQMLLGANAAAWLRLSPRLVPPTATPQTSVVVREATLGRMAGFDFVEVPELADNDIFAVTRDALVIANVAPEVPRGVIAGSHVRANNWTMRHVFSYAAEFLQDASIYSTFMGVSSVNDDLAYTTNADGQRVLLLDEESNPVPSGKNARGGYAEFNGDPLAEFDVQALVAAGEAAQAPTPTP